MSASPPARRPMAGLDAARLLALAAVFYSHACSLMERDDLRTVAGYWVGRVGTAVFFLLSGFLAVSAVRTPGAALRKRLVRIYPAFWVALGLSFTAAAFTGYKSFDAWQVVSQFAGTGLFTHPDSLVGVHTWFVSALLLMYVVVYLDGLAGGRAVPAAAAALLGLHFLSHSVALTATTTHGLLFLAAYAVGKLPGSYWLGFAAVAVLSAGLAAIDPLFRHGTVAAAVLSVASLWAGRCRPARWFAGYAYEWFLLHGVCLHAAAYAFGRESWFFVVPAAVGTLASAVLLRHGLDRIGGRLKGLAKRRENGDDTSTSLPAAMVETDLDQKPLPDGPSPCSASSATGRPSATGLPAATSSPRGRHWA
ncbi:MAG TPA: acyltransferase family protein [Gemmata sp.]|nr:acyltransferase family protein [Gemmata sp.]